MRKKMKAWQWLCLALIALLFPVGSAQAAGELTLFAPQPFVAVTPGESVSHSIELINNTGSVQTAEMSVNGLPEGWEYELRSGGKNARQVAVKAHDYTTATLEIHVPLQVERGVYRFTLSAGNGNTLPLAIEVTEQGTYKTELTTDQPNIEGHADASFSYAVELRNRTAEKQVYALRAETPGDGWSVSFTSSGERVSSVSVEPDATQNITVEVKAPEKIEAGTYTIKMLAETSATSASLDLQTAIIGSYAMELSTPTGLLSTDITAGKNKKVELVVRNTGTAPLEDVSLTSSTPVNWTVEFEPAAIDSIPPGEERSVMATVTASDTALAGDYALIMTATAPEVSSDAQFRISVKTSVFWGWFGILIIAAVAVALYYLFRKYGRR